MASYSGVKWYVFPSEGSCTVMALLSDTGHDDWISLSKRLENDQSANQMFGQCTHPLISHPPVAYLVGQFRALDPTQTLQFVPTLAFGSYIPHPAHQVSTMVVFQVPKTLMFTCLTYRPYMNGHRVIVCVVEFVSIQQRSNASLMTRFVNFNVAPHTQ